MRKTILWMFVVAVCLGSISIPAMAQDKSMDGPPKVLMVTREEIKPGRAAAHTQHEAAWAQAAMKANYKTPYLAASSVTGTPEAWYFFGFDSFAAMEADSEMSTKNAAIRHVNETYSSKEGEFLSDLRTITMRYRPDFSYKAGVNVGEYKYFQINVVRFRLGESVEDFYKAINGAREKAGYDGHVAVYQVNSGMPSGTYISFTPVKSMADWDAPPNPKMDAAFKEINFGQMVGKMIMNAESRLYAFAPEMSNVSDKMAAANPEFWRPKPVMAKKAGTGDVTPAAKKDAKK